MGLGWNMVSAEDRSVDAIVDALRDGNFHPSPGVRITTIEVSDERIRIETENAQRIVALRDTARRIAVVNYPIMEVEVPEEATYIRF